MPKLVYFDDNSQKLSRSGTVSTKISSINHLILSFLAKNNCYFPFISHKVKADKDRKTTPLHFSDC